MIVRERFPISELVARTRVPAATVHHYLRLGLLPDPERPSPNRFLYDDRHVQGVRLIRTLRERRGLSLRAIGRILPELLGLDMEQAFRPEMWDRAVGLHLRRDARRTPSARILETAAEAFARRGYGAVNVDDLCRAARVAKGSFYRHYRSKEELFFAVCETLGAEIHEAFVREVGRRSPSEERAAEVLAGLLEARLPVFLELVVGAMQGRPGYQGVARRVLGGLAHELGGLLRSRRRPVEGGAAVLRGAVGSVLRGLMEPAAVGLTSPSAARS